MKNPYVPLVNPDGQDQYPPKVEIYATIDDFPIYGEPYVVYYNKATKEFKYWDDIKQRYLTITGK